MSGGNLDVKHLWIAAPGAPGSVSEATAEYPGQLGKVGTVKASAGDLPVKLQFIKRKSTDTTVAAALYNVAYWSDLDNFEVVADQTLALGGSTAPIPAGIFLGTSPAAGSFGFIQVAGSAYLDQAGADATDIVVGNPLYEAGGNADGKVTGVTVGTDITTVIAEILVRKRPVVGYALAAETDSTATVAAVLAVARNGW